MNVSLFLARRLSLSSEGKKSSPAVRVAIAAVALSVTVMAAAIAIVTGFKNEITRKVAGFNSHISIQTHVSADDADDAERNVFQLTPSLQKILDETPYIEDYSLQVSMPAIFKTQSDFNGVYLKSLSGRELNNFISESLIEGEMPDYANPADSAKIVISRSVASRLGLKAGSDIDTYFITDHVMVRRLKVAAIFDSHFEAYDAAFAYAPMKLIRNLANLKSNEGVSIAVSVDDFDNVEQYSQDLQDRLVGAYSEGYIYRLYRVSNARQSGATYFNWLNMLDMNVIVILTLMTIVACVTLVSGMLILMIDKVRFIAILAALGASRKLISRTFMLLAARIALYGLLIGNTLALTFLYLQKYTHFIPLDPDSYYIDFVPVEVSLAAIAILDVAIMLIIWVVLILPARFAGKAAPARTLSAE